MKEILSFASNLCFKSFGIIIDSLTQNTKLQFFPYFLGSLIILYVIECVCRLKMTFLHHKMSLVHILTVEFSQEKCLQRDLHRLH
jgi:hypothetical protein